MPKREKPIPAGKVLMRHDGIGAEKIADKTAFDRVWSNKGWAIVQEGDAPAAAGSAEDAVTPPPEPTGSAEDRASEGKASRGGKE